MGADTVSLSSLKLMRNIHLPSNVVEEQLFKCSETCRARKGPVFGNVRW